MILYLIIEMAIIFIGWTARILLRIGVSLEILASLGKFLAIIYDGIEFGVNFVHFIIGDSMYAFVLFAIMLLEIKYLIFPLVVLIRRIFIKGGDT